MRTKIIRATLDIIGRSGFKKFTVDDIAAHLGISKKTIYKHFTTKEEIIHAVIKSSLDTDRENTLTAIENESNWMDKLRAAILFHPTYKIPAHILNELEYLFPDEWEVVNEFREFKKGLIKELLEYGIKNNLIKPDVSPEIILLMMNSTISAVFNYDFLVHNRFSVNQAVDEIIRIIFYGILK